MFHGIKPKKIYVLVANASEARLFETTRLGHSLKLLREFSHPESREKDLELSADRPGSYKSRDEAHGAMEYPKTRKEVEMEHFALELAHALDHDGYDQLVIMAPPHFHSLLDQHLKVSTQDKIAYKVEKDYTKVPIHELVSYLEELRG